MTSVRTHSRPPTRRDVVLDGLVQLFLAEGFMDLTVEELAAHLRCSKTTLYSIAPSKEQLIVAGVRAFFRQATARVEQRIADERDPSRRIAAYLRAISEELAPASPAFFADIDAFAPAREIYSQNTGIAARRVQELVHEASIPQRRGSAQFIGAVAALVMDAINRGEINALTAQDDSTAYHALADLIVAGVTGPLVRG